MNNYFSVVISAYNASDFIGHTLDSVRKQNYKNYEVILVDDGSPVPMKKVIEEYKQKYPEFPLRYVWQENKGPAGARKKCAEEAQYKYIAMLDHDDIWRENKLSVMNEVVSEHEADVYYHDEMEVWENGKQKEIKYRQLGKDAVTDLVLNGNTLSTSAVVIDRDFFIKCNPYEDCKRYGEDYECWIRLAKGGARFYHVDKVLGEYRRLNNSLTMVNENYVRRTNELIVEFYDYLDREKFSEEEINSLKEKQKCINEYSLGRFYHRKKEYAKAKEYYRKSKNMGNTNIKNRIALIFATLHICI